MSTTSTPLPLHLRKPLALVLRAAQRRAVFIALLFVMPLTLALALLVALLVGGNASLAVFILGAILFLVASTRTSRKLDWLWLARRLDHALPGLQDSTTLALLTGNALTPLQQLQQARMRESLTVQLMDHAAPDLRPSVPWRRLRPLLLLSALLVMITLALPLMQAWWFEHAAASVDHDSAATTHVDAELRVTPPAYTGIAPLQLTTLDAKVPADSHIAWSLKLQPQPTAAALVFGDGSRLPLAREGERWQAERVLAVSSLYRIELTGAPAIVGRSNRLDAMVDQPPEVTVRTPEKTLTLLTADQKSWSLAFEARDDYGLGEAALTVTLAQGTGDNIKTTEQRIVLEGSGDKRGRRYEKKLDLTALGFAKGDDLIIRLSVADNHPPQPNVSNSASFILRWPPDKSTESEGMEGLVQKTLPAYFRSERQIIIDTEALQAKRSTIDAHTLEKQADELGVDQKVLRLRYGQFLGEGFETAGEKAPQDEHAKEGDKLPAGASEALRQLPNDGDHAVADSPVIGREEDVLHEFGHAHDNAEATTLLDPETRRILKAALDEMWQAELNLRQAKPDLALPFEYKALDYIKQVQQAERIYLARAGLELPQVDTTRRLTGKREGLSDRSEALPAPESDDSPVPGLWSALSRSDAVIDTAVLGTWIASHPDAVSNPQDLLAAADRVQHEPDCAACRTELRSRLWPLLPLPPTAVVPRAAPDAAGAAYLDALKASSPGATP